MQEVDNIGQRLSLAFVDDRIFDEELLERDGSCLHVVEEQEETVEVLAGIAIYVLR